MLAVGTATAVARGQDDAFSAFNFYFGPGVAQAGDLGASVLAPNGDFWLAGFGGDGLIRRVVDTGGGSYFGTEYVPTLDWSLFQRSTDVIGGIANPDFGGNIVPSAVAGITLNPAPLTIDVVTGSGGTQSITYAPGTLMFVSDAIAPPILNGQRQAAVGKKVYTYDLRQIDGPSGTSVEPDYDTASSGPPILGGIVFGAFGNADWNDVFREVVSSQDLQDAAGDNGSGGFDNRLAWSSDGQWLYAVDGGVNQGGIYRIDPTRTANQPGGIVRIWKDTDSITNQTRISSDPVVVSTAQHNFAPGVFGAGDQILVEGSFEQGNSGGLNVFFDDRSADQLAAPQPIFNEAEFRRFAEYYTNADENISAPTSPQYQSIAVDSEGNIYFNEFQTDGLYRYDTQGRFVKIANEREQDRFQIGRGAGTGSDLFEDLTVRESTAPGFAVTELLYTDSELDIPVGVFAFKPGDFDRDNDVDADDLSAFSAALRPRNTAAREATATMPGGIPDPTNPDEVGDERFDLNGNEPAFRAFDDNGTPDDTSDDIPLFISTGEPRYRHVNNGQVVVDWKDVKVLQQFVDIPTGDADFDLDLDLDDLDIVAANYYTVDAVADNTWRDGDFGSVDPDYFFEVADVNLVNEVDLGLLADTWLNELGQAAPDEATLAARYAGQFLADALEAFSIGAGFAPGDYDRDGDVDADDYTVWSMAFGETGVGLGADGNGDGVVDAADYVVWRDNAPETNDDPAAPGDYDRDGDVDVDDYALWASAFGQSGAGLAADGNGDGVIDAADYTVWRDNLTGDYNGDGRIDAADYTVWRDQRGQSGVDLAADGDGDGVVGADDYALWAQAFGLRAIAASATSTPEPTSLATLTLGATLAFVSSRRRMDTWGRSR
ncbi:MAG: hypothetical protein AAF805_02680 [Planctomycetota bacterium]